MDDIELLSGVLTKTGDLIDGVRPDQRSLPTPCTEYDVEALLDHIVGWVQVFEAGSEGRTYEGDPTAFHVGDDPAAQFRSSATNLVASWREHGVDREVAISSGAEMPGAMVFNMTVMEYLAHGWDLATATGQPVPYTEDEAAEVLARARVTLPPEYQGAGQAFGAVVEVDDDAPAVDRFVGFLGRHP
jgi:uncharacterized protein (TIGR03086 family)